MPLQDGALIEEALAMKIRPAYGASRNDAAYTHVGLCHGVNGIAFIIMLCVCSLLADEYIKVVDEFRSLLLPPLLLSACLEFIPHHTDLLSTYRHL